MYNNKEYKNIYYYYTNTMGIPSYFSYIIKNYSNIIRNIEYFINNKVAFDSLYMDCNSVIYDTAHLLEKEHPEINKEDFEDILIKTVIKKIEEYIYFIKPKKTVYIAFDGVAPLGKMEQQKKRRYISLFSSKLPLPENKVSKFNTVLITPGTKFMDKFSDIIEKHFFNKSSKFGVEKLILSSPNEGGEGEHKIFRYFKNNSNSVKNDIVALYGLDSDLIMLSLLHLYRVKNIYIFREAPEFIKSAIPINKYKDSELYFLDMLQLRSKIVKEMDETGDINRINDYVLISFFLGNDFLPGLLALNIRENGILILLDAYKKRIVKKGDYIIKNWDIDWKSLYDMLEEISKKEEEIIKNEYISRNKLEKIYKKKSDEEKIRNIGIIKREKELYMNPLEKGWEERYKRILEYQEGEEERYKNKILSVWKYYKLEKDEDKEKVKSVLIKWIIEKEYKEDNKDDYKEEYKEENEKEYKKRYILPNETLLMIGEKEKEEVEYEIEYINKRYIWEGDLKYKKLSLL